MNKRLKLGVFELEWMLRSRDETVKEETGLSRLGQMARHSFSIVRVAILSLWPANLR
jgi:hypothetical protein